MVVVGMTNLNDEDESGGEFIASVTKI